MLKGVDPLLTPELLMHLAAMGHGEWVAVVDANFTAHHLAQGKPVVHLAGHSLARVASAVLSVIPLAEDVEQPAAYMHACHLASGQRTAAQETLMSVLLQESTPAHKVAALERFTFYDQTRQASLIIQTGELTPYGNALFCKGVITQPVAIRLAA